jgi:integrase
VDRFFAAVDSPFVTLAIETGPRYGVIRTLQWGSVDFENRCLQWGKDKTVSGTRRVIPLSQRALAALNFWATHFPDRKSEHYVFPAERYGAAADQFCAKAYDVDPSKPIGSIKEAWEAAKLRAGRILKGIPKGTRPEEKTPPLVCRFHDLRHTAVFPDAERGNTHCEGCQDCRVESGHDGAHGRPLWSLLFE